LEVTTGKQEFADKASKSCHSVILFGMRNGIKGIRTPHWSAAEEFMAFVDEKEFLKLWNKLFGC
jgi:hypothetical protein